MAIIYKVMYACIFFILIYTALAWWPGHIWTNRKKQTKQNSIERLCTKLDKVQNIALCVVLPIWRTLFISILQKEAKTLLVYYTFDHLCKLAII